MQSANSARFGRKRHVILHEIEPEAMRCQRARAVDFTEISAQIAEPDRLQNFDRSYGLIEYVHLLQLSCAGLLTPLPRAPARHHPFRMRLQSSGPDAIV